MFGKHLNQIRLSLSITPNGPLAIRSGRTGADPTRPDLECVRTTFEGQPSVYLPGSSIKGVLRSHAERLLRSENVNITDTFSMEGRKAFKQDSEGPEVYSGTCPIGRTFGNLHVKGRLSVSDHMPGGSDPTGSDERREQVRLANEVTQRNGVGIDRLTGSASTGALFDIEAVVQGRFDGQITLRNAQLYQLALALFVLRDLDEGWVRLGSSSSRGFGEVKVEIRELVIESRRGKTPGGQLYGYGSLIDDAAGYDLFPDDKVMLPADLKPSNQLMWQRLVVPKERVFDVAESLVDGPWMAFLNAAKAKKGWAA